MSGIAAPQTVGTASAGLGISYQPPTITDIQGPGVRHANTAGGQAVTLIGTQFGPVSSSYPNTSTIGYIDVQYTGNGLTFQAALCSVTTTTAMTCITGPGIGANLDWTLNLGGQASNTLANASSYGPPTIASFSSVLVSNPNALLTGGGESVVRAGGRCA